jgi:hypothetical protein
MADLVLDRHSYDGDRLHLTGRVVGAWTGRSVRAALLPAASASDHKPLVERVVAVDANGLFRVELPTSPVPHGTRLVLVDADDDKTFWIGSGANVPPGWFSAGVPTGLPGTDPLPGSGGTPPTNGGGGTPPPTRDGGGGGNGTTPGRINFKIPCLCALLPFDCTTLLGAWKALMLLAIGIWYASVVLFPPDWGLRSAWCIVTDEGLKAGRLVGTTASAGAGGAAGGAATTGAAGGVGGAGVGTAVAPGPGTAAGGVGGGAVGAGVGGTGGGTGSATTAATTEATVQTIDRTVRGIIGLADGIVALVGIFSRLLAELVSLAALAILILWLLCCARGDRCRLISNVAWVLEAATVVVIPTLGSGVGLFLWAVAFLPQFACSRVGTQWFLSLLAGTLLTTIIYGVVRWLRDKGKCPVLVLWQWPWTEKQP